MTGPYALVPRVPPGLAGWGEDGQIWRPRRRRAGGRGPGRAHGWPAPYL